VNIQIAADVHRNHAGEIEPRLPATELDVQILENKPVVHFHVVVPAAGLDRQIAMGKQGLKTRLDAEVPADIHRVVAGSGGDRRVVLNRNSVELQVVVAGDVERHVQIARDDKVGIGRGGVVATVSAHG